MIERSIQLRGPLDLHLTLGPLVHGRGDRTIRLERGAAWLAMRTPDGPATLHIAHHAPTTALARAWGPGAEEMLSALPRALGAEDDPLQLVQTVRRRIREVDPSLPVSGIRTMREMQWKMPRYSPFGAMARRVLVISSG